MINYTPPASDIIELKNEIKKLKEQLESETLAKNEGAEIVAELKAKNRKLKYDIETYHSQYKALTKQNGRLEEEKEKLKKQLNIAIECLEHISGTCDVCVYRASYALHLIDELNESD